MQNKIKYFSGFMSASVGFEFAEQVGFECVLGNELNPTRAKWSISQCRSCSRKFY